MAKIEKMVISGLRSYSPDVPGAIEFQTPLTLIVGTNGSGKTSIIECLNYVITGNYPPGSKGLAFVHDPKIANEKEVKGQVKLRMSDIVGNRLHCTRSVMATQKAKKIEVKSLEGVIMKMTPSGERESISQRCTDFTKEMISRLGVSKAVIDNVIFCHQEEANWPLSEGKVLKTKFDEIFSATRYIKALESIRNTRKDQTTVCKSYQSELTYLAERKQEYVELTKNLAKAEAQKTISEDHVTNLTEQVAPLEKDLEELKAASEEIFKIDKKIGEFGKSKQHLNDNVRDLEKKIKNPFQGSEADLLRLESEFKEKLELKETTLGNLENSVNQYDKEIREMDGKRNFLNNKQGKLQQEAEQHKQQIDDRDTLVKQVAGKYDIPGYDGGKYTSSEVESFMDAMRDIHKNNTNEGQQLKDQHNEELQQLNEKIRNLEKSLHGYETTVEQKKKLITANESKLRNVNEKLNSLSNSENRIQGLERELNRAEIDLKEFKGEEDVEKSKEEIRNIEIEREREQAALTELREEERRMMQQSKAQATVDLLSKDKANKESTIESLLRRHEETVAKIFEERPPREEMKSELSQFMRTKQTEIRKFTTEYQKMSQAIAGLESRKKMLEKECSTKEEQMKKFEKRIHQTCKENDYNTFREQVQQQVQQHTGTLVEIGAFEKIYQKYLKQLQSKEVEEKDCPLCHRKFDSAREVRNLVEDVTEKLAKAPESRERTQNLLDEVKGVHKDVMELGPVKANLDSLCETLPSVQSELATLVAEIEKERATLLSLETKKVAAEDGEKSGRGMESDVRKMDDCLFELKEIDRKLTTESSKLQGVAPGRTMQSLSREVEEKQEKVNGLGKRVDQKKNRLMEFTDQVSIREKEVNDLRADKLKLQSQLQERVQLETQKADLSSTNQSYEREIREARERLQPIQSDLREKNENKSNVERKREKCMQEVREKLDRIKTCCGKIKEKSEAIEQYIADGKPSDLQNNQELLKSINDRLQKKTEARDEKKKEVVAIKEEITNQTLNRQEIENNIKLMNTRKEIKTITEKIDLLKAEASKFGGYKDVMKERSNLEEQLDKYREERATLLGRLKGFEDQIKTLKRDLKSAKYAEADLKHCSKLVEIRTTELANKDLDKYYRALEQAISRYHQLKLAEINKIIKEYWVKTYRGNDIETIEIRTEVDEEGSGASKAKRVYNYSVCMIKGGVPLEMRGRCSAGQKVLASIIIRLALAETFCLNCGILALDEPTTNLDADNIESLANALKDIIQMRMQQKNFQIVIITHDEEFVQGLGRSDFVDTYYRIYKDPNGHSKIHRQQIEHRE